MEISEQQDTPGVGVPGGRVAAQLAEALGGSVRASAVFGDPVERDGVTVVPVARVRYGFGGGGGAGSGGGGGAIANPAGFIELRAGGVRYRPIGTGRRLLLAFAAGGLAATLADRALGSACRAERGRR